MKVHAQNYKSTAYCMELNGSLTRVDEFSVLLAKSWPFPFPFLPRARHEFAVFVKKKRHKCSKSKLKTKQQSLKAFSWNSSISRISLEKIRKQFLVLSWRRTEFQIACVLCSVLNLRLKKVHSFTPLCNRPSGIFILAGFSGKKSLGWPNSHWVGLVFD